METESASSDLLDIEVPAGSGLIRDFAETAMQKIGSSFWVDGKINGLEIGSDFSLGRGFPLRLSADPPSKITPVESPTSSEMRQTQRSKPVYTDMNRVNIQSRFTINFATSCHDLYFSKCLWMDNNGRCR
ncbi:hypothetical protein G6K98_32060 [Agrobacterium rhizogenes]|nr:hypothetical protein [Rhizobium rhizogenes]NTH62154.1 hypothetical protein [Rhizobium rhizogenes]NTH93780.1 hypothetical protein [Rhizobium rhizogenes]